MRKATAAIDDLAADHCQVRGKIGDLDVGDREIVPVEDRKVGELAGG